MFQKCNEIIFPVDVRTVENQSVFDYCVIMRTCYVDLKESQGFSFFFCNFPDVFSNLNLPLVPIPDVLNLSSTLYILLRLLRILSCEFKEQYSKRGLSFWIRTLKV